MAAASLSQDGQSNEFSSTSMKIEESPGSDSIEELDKAMASSKSTKGNECLMIRRQMPEE